MAVSRTFGISPSRPQKRREAQHVTTLEVPDVENKHESSPHETSPLGQFQKGICIQNEEVTKHRQNSHVAHVLQMVT